MSASRHRLIAPVSDTGNGQRAECECGWISTYSTGPRPEAFRAAEHALHLRDAREAMPAA